MDKNSLRRLGYDARNQQPNKESLSEIICQKFIHQSAYQQADVILWYVHCRTEVRTVSTIEQQLLSSKKIVIPFCTQDAVGENKLGLWHLECLSELVPGCWGILEPPEHRWFEPAKSVSADEIDLVMVPGVAFDRSGGRLGNGAGYYDRLFKNLRDDALLIGVCYESQILNQVLMEKNDVYMDKVLTETDSYEPGLHGKGKH